MAFVVCFKHVANYAAVNPPGPTSPEPIYMPPPRSTSAFAMIPMVPTARHVIGRVIDSVIRPPGGLVFG